MTIALAACSERAMPTQPGSPGPAGAQALRSTGPIAFVSDRDGTDRIYLADEDGANVTPLVAGAGPAWSRDGRQIAFHVGGAWTVHVINVDGSGDRTVTRGRSPAWSPDGGSLVFEDWESADPDINVVAVDGSSRHPLYDSGGFGSFGPTWSPDGSRILFSVGTFVDLELGLWTVNADGSGAQPFGPGLFWDAWSPAWSPDGSEIAFVSQAGIEVVGADGSGRHVRVPGSVSSPDWTPDGRLIYNRGTVLGPSRIFITDGGRERQLIPDATTGTFNVGYNDGQAVWRR